MLASTLPANAAVGHHAAFFSESDFLAKSAGQTGQFAVGYTNTGDQSWVKGAANQQANLATAAPLDNTTDFTAGWGNGWLSANRYTAQDAALVAPGQIGFFIYNVTVPANAAAGEHRFFGREVIDGVTWMEDYGYYQSVTVIASTVKITSTTPASPSSNKTPVVNGTGASVSAAVTIRDGTTPVGTGVADSAGTFQIPTSTLAVGSHSLTACAGGACSVAFSYVVSTAPPPPAPPPPTVTAIAPTSGSTLGGTAVTISGSGFSITPLATTVTFGATAAAVVLCAFTTSCTATSPAGAAGPVDVTVTVAGLTSATSAADLFTYLTPAPAPTVTSVSPTSGSTLGGTAVTISGSGFSTGATVTVGGILATGVALGSASSISATTPPGAAGAANVVVTNLDLQTGSCTGCFTYVTP